MGCFMPTKFMGRVRAGRRGFGVARGALQVTWAFWGSNRFSTEILCFPGAQKRGTGGTLRIFCNGQQDRFYPLAGSMDTGSSARPT